MAPPGGGVSYLTTDNLGSPRVITDANGGVKARHDYLPFGEEMMAGTGGRTSQQGYVMDNVRQKFTGYERDTETGFDYAQARYYASAQGRFTSIDPLMASARASNPQTWNRYSYTVNNPLRYVDPSGLASQDPEQLQANCIVGSPGCDGTGSLGVTVTVPISFDDAPIETTSTSLITSLATGAGQVASDTVVGFGKGVYNSFFGLTNTINAPIDYGLSFFTDFRFGQVPLSEASTGGEQSAMLATAIVGVFASGGTAGPTLTVGSGRAYSVAFQTRLSASSFPGVSRASHFQEANANLLNQINADRGFATVMDDLIPGIQGQLLGPRGGISRRPPSGWTWHHAPEPGVMQLVPTVQHQAPGNIQNLLHPGGRGGYAIWGR